MYSSTRPVLAPGNSYRGSMAGAHTHTHTLLATMVYTRRPFGSYDSKLLIATQGDYKGVPMESSNTSLIGKHRLSNRHVT